MIEKITIELNIGSNLRNAIETGVILATQNNCLVEFDFNGFLIKVDKHTIIDEKIKIIHSILKD